MKFNIKVIKLDLPVVKGVTFDPVNMKQTGHLWPKQCPDVKADLSKYNSYQLSSKIVLFDFDLWPLDLEINKDNLWPTKCPAVKSGISVKRFST